MAKKEKKKDKQASQGVEHDAIAAVRAAVERTLQVSAEGAQSTRDRTREIVEEIAQAAGRIRTTIEDMHILDEIKNLRREVEALAARVASLEIGPKRGSAPAKPAAAKKPAAKAAATKGAAKPRARKNAAKKPAARKTAASKRAATPKPAAAAAPEAPKPAAPESTASES